MATQVVDNFLPNGFLRRSEALVALGVSDATIERMARDERIRSKLVPVPGRKPERVFLAEDVEKLKAQKDKRRQTAPPSALVRHQSPPPRSVFFPGEDVKLALAPDTAATVRELFSELLASFSEPRPVPVQAKLWLNWEEAVALSGIPKRYLRDLCSTREVVAMQFGRSWRVSRISLESYLP